MIRQLYEEFAGLTDKNTIADRVPGSAPPTWLGRDKDKSIDPILSGQDNCSIQSMTKSSKGNGLGSDTQVRFDPAPPTWLGQDNSSIQSMTMIESSKGKGLRRCTRVISHCRSLVKEKLITVELVPTIKQEADLMSKQFYSPTSYWRAAIGPLGDHPALRDIQERVRNRRGSRKQRKLLATDSIISKEHLETDIDSDEDEHTHSLKNSNDTVKVLLLLSEDRELINLANESSIVRSNTIFNRDANKEWRDEAEDLVINGFGYQVNQHFAKDYDEFNFILHQQGTKRRNIIIQ